MTKRLLLLAVCHSATLAAAIYVSPSGQDRNPGTEQRPVASLAAAQKLARQQKSQGPVTVLLKTGTYYLPETFVLTPQDSGTTYAAAPGQTPTLSGGARLNLKWQPYKDGIVMAKVPTGLQTDQLFINGQRQNLARYPNFDATSAYFNG
ncbi:MAG: hypothetical protein EBY17_20475 [Acidobacteriia bacterium]|nr:hypothetical protein [Terriglobia bacterium]